MSIKKTESNLQKALLKNGTLSKKLFDYELNEHVDSFITSKIKDQDEYLLVVTEHSNDVAMILIDKNDDLFVNYEARTKLQSIWRKYAYSRNLKLLIPKIASRLNEGSIFECGFKTQSSKATADLPRS